MKIIAFIPSRYGSTRFPGKPLAPILGKPMIQHVYHCAGACPEVSEVYVATDDERILQCVKDFGGKAVLTSRRHASGSDRIAEAAVKTDARGNDIILNVQGDQPVFHPSILTQMVEPLMMDPELPMSTLMRTMTDHSDIQNPNHVKVITDSEGFALYFSRLPIPYDRDGTKETEYRKHLGFYAFRMHFLLTYGKLPKGKLETAEKLEQLRVLENGYRIKVVEIDQDSISVDTPGDIPKIEKMIKR